MASESPDVWAQLNEQARTEIGRRRVATERACLMERQRIAEKMAADQMLNSGAFVGAVVAAVHQAFSTFAEGATSTTLSDPQR